MQIIAADRRMTSALIAGLGFGLAACHTLGGAPQTLSVMKPERFARWVNVDGRAFTSIDSTVNVYLDRPISAGKYYWEVRVMCGPISPGVTNNVAEPLSYGGYSNRNAGVYTWFANVWPKPADEDRSDAWRRRQAVLAQTGWAISPAGSVFGFALDADARTLRTFWEGDEGPTLQMDFPGPYYPHSGTQAGFPNPRGQPCGEPVNGESITRPYSPASGAFMTRRGETRYRAPPGYRLLGE